MRFRIIIIVLLFSLILLSCSQSPETDSRTEFEDLPVAQLKLISDFDQSGEYFFQHLNYSSIALPNGDIILNDRAGSFIIRVNPQGELIDLIARQGNGPGEIQDPLSIQMVDDSTLLIVDQRRQKIIRKTLDSSAIEEFTLPRTETSRVNEAYATEEPDIINVNWWNFSALTQFDAESKSRISSYNLVSEATIKDLEYPGDIHALFLSDNGQPRGSTKVPFSAELLYDYSQDKTELYAFWPEDYQITVFDPIELDTLRTIPVNLISESLSSTERDSLEREYQKAQWVTVKELLPEQKVPADKMIIDSQNRIWLKLTVQSDSQEWIVLDQNGTPEFRAQFPKEGIVTHISEQHIGFRADDHLFSLYELGE
jgi:hypothetical protein